ncbi:hypothetical protein F5890DRAFT_33344 [Lentinula detonsa]|uniref:Uncharacterized protein n=1 Tax=Lentinula detonsa TaxID=2804962 RepID=A0AA38Q9V7_9AGAR|nr:hypothetical protein F5890DRAFT_33344 [Lentinula detonsa]
MRTLPANKCSIRFTLNNATWSRFLQSSPPYSYYLLSIARSILFFPELASFRQNSTTQTRRKTNTMTLFSFYKIALLISFGILSLSFVCVDAGPVTKDRTQTVAENPVLRWTPFEPTKPMGYAYAKPNHRASRAVLSHLQPSLNLRKCVVYDQHEWFSDPTLSVVSVSFVCSGTACHQLSHYKQLHYRTRL